MSKSLIQSEEEIKQRIIDCLRDINWDIIMEKKDTVMMKLEEAQKLAQEWRQKKGKDSDYSHPIENICHKHSHDSL